MNDQCAVGILQKLPQSFVQIEFLRRKVEPRRLRLPGIDLLFEGNSLHRISGYDHVADAGEEWGWCQRANLQILDSWKPLGKQRVQWVVESARVQHLIACNRIAESCPKKHVRWKMRT